MASMKLDNGTKDVVPLTLHGTNCWFIYGDIIDLYQIINYRSCKVIVQGLRKSRRDQISLLLSSYSRRRSWRRAEDSATMPSCAKKKRKKEAPKGRKKSFVPTREKHFQRTPQARSTGQPFETMSIDLFVYLNGRVRFLPWHFWCPNINQVVTGTRRECVKYDLVGVGAPNVPCNDRSTMHIFYLAYSCL